MKTILKKLKSTSTTMGGADAIHHTLTKFGLKLTPDDLAMTLSEYLENRVGANRKHNSRVKAIDDNGVSMAHLNQTLDYLSVKFIEGLGFVRASADSDCAGDIGIAYGVSYVVSEIPKTKPLEEAKADLFLPLGNPQFGVSFHVQVALPNGFNTSMRVTSAEKMDDREGFIEYKSFYWDPVVAGTEVIETEEAEAVPA